MSSRSTEPPVSLPPIHELFPEHLMHSPPVPGSSRTHPHGAQRHTSVTASPHRSHPQSPSFTRPREEASRAAVESPYHYPSHNPNDNYAPHSRATFAHRPLSAPHVSVPPAEGPSSRLPSQQMHMPHYRDSDQHGRSGHPVVSIPSSHSGRPPKGQDPNGYPNSHSIVHPGPSHPPPPLDDPELSDEDTPSTGAPSGIPRKHICPICRKAFNRPSSLKIHYNTHTGATPFRCPWPKCGREFNVNSNMRRHYRNHTANANQESQDDGARRRRRRSSASSPNPPPSLPVMQQSVGETRSQPQTSGGPRHQVINPSQYDVAPRSSDSSHHQYSRYRVYDYGKDYQGGMDVDNEADEYHVSEDPHRSSRLPVPVMQVSQTIVEPRGSEHLHPSSRHSGAPGPHQERALHHHSHSSTSTSSSSMRIRALTPGSSFHSSSPSPSPSPSMSSNASPFNSPPPSTLTSPANSPAMLPRTDTHAAGQHYHYSPSMPYLRSTGDPHVSTALRPVFNVSNTRR
ncbi:hypothetical protein NP233_g4422 [Leucocoprinus birnbaumii]|uniref:C2H2-type domain-containing protein n=1 Tax=Leucocoprinus birnbaumii TaxID=56174 RepID=A0AAD5VX98_9AGAR|nr:hypothetical protein NP233_g4422 [Leucocoprinus birnbaumii]